VNDDNDIPILNVLRQQLVAGIADQESRRRRLPVAAIVAGAVATAVAVIAAVLLAGGSGGPGRQVVTRGPAGQPGQTTAAGFHDTTTVTAVSGLPPAGPTTSARPAASTPIVQVAPPTHPGVTSSSPAATTTTAATATPTTVASGPVLLTVANNQGTIAVSPGTIINVHLDGGTASIWPTEPTSSDGAVLQHRSGSSIPTSSQSVFVAQARGTAQLAATGLPPCAVQPPPTGPPQACPAYAALWTATVTVR
jgi:hypothetical protein